MCRLLPYLLLIALLHPSCLQAQDTPFPLEFLTDGHTPGQVAFKFQDSRGFLWGRDKNGAPARYDGHQLDLFQYDPADSTTVSDGAVWGFNRGYNEDSRGRIWITYSTNNNLDCYDPQTEQFQRFRSRMRTFVKKGGNGRFHCVFEDSRNTIWIGNDNGLFKYDPETDSILSFTRLGIVMLIFEDPNRNIWLSVYKDFKEHALGRIDPETGEVVEWIDYPPMITGYPFDPQQYFAFPRKDDSSIYLVIDYFLLEFDPKKHSLTWRHEDILDKDELIYDYWSDGETVLFTTSAPRLIRFFPATCTITTIYDWSDQVEEGEVLYVTDPFQSNDGTRWVFASKEGGKVPLNHTMQFFPKKLPFRSTPRSPSIPLLLELDDFVLKLKGQAYFFTPPVLQAVRPEVADFQKPDLSKDEFPNGQKFHTQFTTDADGNLWMTEYRYNSDLYIREFNPRGELIFSHLSKKNTKEDGEFPGGMPKDLSIDQDGKLWIATWGVRLIVFDPATRKFKSYSEEIGGHSSSNAVLADQENNIWCGTWLRLSHFKQRTGEWTHFDPETSHLSGSIVNIFQDKRGAIWVATFSGLYQFQKDIKDFKYYGPDHGLENGAVHHTFEDRYGQLWATGDQLYWYDEGRDLFLGFGEKEGVPFGGGGYDGYTFDDDGYVFLHSSAGGGDICYFKPEMMTPQPEVPAIHFTDLFLFNEKVKPRAPDGILPLGLDFVEKIQFHYHQNDFAIRFTAPEYIHPEKLSFFIKMEGFHKEWQNLGNAREARFTGLPPGNYTFRVKVRDRFFFESESPRTLLVTILPPWYRTTWAYTLWLTLTLATVYSLYRYQLRRRLAIEEARRLKELDLAKTQLYTNITHEFRTPLTIILGMAEQMKRDPKNWFNEGIGMIRRNGKQLLNLVNQLLDLSKLESGHMPLNLVKGDVIAFLQYLIESFHSYADSKDIRLHFIPKLTELEMDYDPEKLQHVVSNLLSNAIKFTPAGGDVYVQVFEGREQRAEGREKMENLPSSPSPLPFNHTLQFSVMDTGVGIAPEHLPHIFDRFYQADASATRRGEGTGIGLALTRELIRVMGGTIEVESVPGKGTTFTIQLPITQTAGEATRTQDPPVSAILKETLVLPPTARQAPAETQGELPIVLLVEDNADVLTYLSSFLSNDYQIVTATDGQEGIDKALELIPDLIVSDVMMPEVDGFELCAALKTDERTSHIPIILLTAKSDQRSKLEGLTHGADAYLAKPFQQEELLVRMENLIALRRKLQERFQKTGELRQILKAPVQTPDEAFIQKVFQLIEDNLGDEDFGMPQLCKELRLSRSHLFRKIKALTGKSATHLIRSMRLEKAKELLETTHLTVSEVCYAVGFNSPNYFSRAFKEEFGVGPSEVRGK